MIVNFLMETLLLSRNTCTELLEENLNETKHHLPVDEEGKLVN